jgi:hypothetical protein
MPKSFVLRISYGILAAGRRGRDVEKGCPANFTLLQLAVSSCSSYWRPSATKRYHAPEDARNESLIQSIIRAHVWMKCLQDGTQEDETFDVGQDTRTGVAMVEYRYDPPFKFTGKIDKLTFKLEPFTPEQEAKAKP